MYLIAKSNNKQKPNWSGKEFSEYAAKIYTSFSDMYDALAPYFCEGEIDLTTGIQIKIIVLSDERKTNLIKRNLIRW